MRQRELGLRLRDPRNGLGLTVEATMKSIERKMDPAVLDQRLEARLHRQQLLDQEAPPRYRALLDEAVLHRQVGGPAVIGDNSPQRPVVFVEGLYSNRYLERPAEIDRYREALDYLRDAGLSPRDSMSLITEIRNRHKA